MTTGPFVAGGEFSVVENTPDRLRTLSLPIVNEG